MSKTTVVFGAAGTGKSTYIINELQARFKDPDGQSFAYITFTKASADDFKKRLQAKFNLEKDEVKALWVGTQHSLCLRLLGRDKEIVGVKDYKEFCSVLKIDFDEKKHRIDDEILGGEINESAAIGNKAVLLDQTCRLQMRAVTNTEMIQHFGGDFTTKDMEMFSREWKNWKAANNRLDFVDMLEKTIESNLTLPIKRIYFDEFQDVGTLQYKVYALWRDAPAIERVLIAGDDDQAIFTFLGASPKFMLDEIGERIILGVNYRNPQGIYEHARNLISLNKYRQKKEIVCINKSKGIIEEIDMSGGKPEDLVKHIHSNEPTFVLTRTNRQYLSICDVFDQLLIPYQRIKAGTPWTKEFLAFLEAVRKVEVAQNEKLDPMELHAFIYNVPQKNYILRGSKQTLMKMFDPISFNQLKAQYLKNFDQPTLQSFASGSEVRLATITEAAISKLKSSRQRVISERYSVLKFPVLPKMDVWIGTIHSSKGLETNTVILIDSIPRKVANAILDNTAALEAERRVYYVAITRPRERIVFVFNLFDRCESFLKR